jgi:hypothetical protein
MKPRSKLKPLLALFIFALGLVLLNKVNTQQVLDADAAQQQLALSAEPGGSDGGDLLIAEAFRAGRSNVQVSGMGKVINILPDDDKGSRHQRFLLELESGHTILIAHNIDLAPRVDAVQEGELMEFYGEYEWNKKGGVIHWTHHDPKGIHPGGWLKYQGKVYK